MISIICIIIVLILLPFIIVDIWVTYNTWQSRIFIGKWRNKEEWQEAVRKKTIRWLNHIPTIPVSDEKRLILWDMLWGKYGNSNIQSWQYAGLLFGLEEKYAESFAKSHKYMESESVDNALLLYVLFKKGVLSQHELRLYADKMGLCEQDTIPYRKRMPDIRFVDSIGMLVPFLVASGYSDKALNQIKEYDKALLNGIFPPHAYNIKKHLPLGIYDWSRGLGWYILGITETMELEGNSNRVLSLANEMLKYQHGKGGISSMFFSSSSFTESSGTVLLGVLFCKAYEITKDLKYMNAVNKTISALMRITRRNGEIDYAQGDTKGIGRYSNRYDVMPFVQGMTLYLLEKSAKNNTIRMSFNC